MTAVVALLVLLALVARDGPVCHADGRALVWEAWEENAPAGSASEGAHVWVSRGLYQRWRELGMGEWQAASSAMGTMLLWEVFEVRGMDAEGVSVQDIVANSVGIAAGLTDVGVGFSYAAHIDPPERQDKLWLNIPGVPRNRMTYAIELEHGGWALGYKYLAEEGDIVIGTTTMPVHGGEHGGFTAVPYVGYQWKTGWHAAAGYDPAVEGIMSGGGYRVSTGGIGVDLTGLLHDNHLTFGVGLSIEFDSLF